MKFMSQEKEHTALFVFADVVLDPLSEKRLHFMNERAHEQNPASKRCQICPLLNMKVHYNSAYTSYRYCFNGVLLQFNEMIVLNS